MEFLFSFLDIIYSYISVDKCQTLETSSIILITLNIWLCVNGIFGLCYFLLYIFSSEKQKGYELLVKRNSEEKCEIFYKSFLLLLCYYYFQ